MTLVISLLNGSFHIYSTLNDCLYDSDYVMEIDNDIDNLMALDNPFNMPELEGAGFSFYQ